MAKQNVYQLALSAIGEVSDFVMARSHHDSTMSNPPTQLVGNRVAKNVQAEIETPDGVVNVHLIGWQPAREGDEPGYNGEVVPPVKAASNAILQVYREGRLNDLKTEACAALTYFVEQLYTGYLYSYENAIKARAAYLIAQRGKLKVRSMTIEKKDGKPFQVNATQAKAIVTAGLANWNTIEELDPKVGKRRTRSHAIKF